ncbi:lysylphosphatidylglycerol synthase domain-containing protein [Pleurocapsa sp. FMAR1]|uniref:lysylphosphatidylglycerol synthase domain-containing protein n=1 Tax=Pleurocapsa sp. FMAR1 TaxID=3040204 RepID=UPI0029C70F60|nr:lysylphosphatidylglycerol synthase domain-containing protein [Pleurocapsa sp. FMAR1]
MNRDRLTRWLYPVLGSLLLVFCLYILNRELGRYSLDDILDSLSRISDRQLYAAIAFTILNCLVISSYDLIAFLHLQYYLSIKRILFTTFITYAISNTTGFTLLIGGGIRYRFYSIWGVPAKSIAKIIALGNLSFWLGLLTLSGLTFVLNPLQLPKSISFDISLIRYLGIVCLILIGIYLFLCKRRKRLRIGKNIISFPKLTISLSQIAIFSLDWASATAVLYCLIPDYVGKSYLSFFSIYLFSMAISILSNIPGGIGIFETIIVFLLPKIPTTTILGSLLAYRAIRFLLPLLTAIILFCCFELKRKLRKSS